MIAFKHKPLMMRAYLFIIIITLASKGIAQSNNSNQFLVSIDSVTTTPSMNPEVLLCYVTFKNLSRETIEFRESSMFKKHQEERMWNLIIKKGGKNSCSWIEKHDVYLFLGNFTIKKGKTKEYVIPLILDEMSVDSNGGVGVYTVQIEVSNVETEKVKTQTLLSNVVEFQIEGPIVEYNKDRLIP